MDISMDIPMDIHEKICGYGCGYGWEISYPWQCVDPRFLAILQACRTSIDPYKRTGIARLTAEIWLTKHGPAHFA